MPYLMASVRSFQRQKYKNKELIVVYSESKDNSLYYLDSLNDKNIKLFIQVVLFIHMIKKKRYVPIVIAHTKGMPYFV